MNHETLKVFWLPYVFPRKRLKDRTEIGLTYVCYTDDTAMRFGAENVVCYLKCADGINRHAFKAFSSEEEMTMNAAVEGWEIENGEKIFGVKSVGLILQ